MANELKYVPGKIDENWWINQMDGWDESNDLFFKDGLKFACLLMSQGKFLYFILEVQWSIIQSSKISISSHLQ